MIAIHRLTTIIIVLLLLAGSSSAREVTSTAGKLSSLLGDAAGETNLKINGTIDVRDLRFVADSLKMLTSLDLSDAKIEEYGADKAGCLSAGVFAGSQITDVTLPSSGQLTIDEMAFLDSRLRNLFHHNNLKTIGLGAFAMCRQLENISLEGVTTVDASAFTGCEALKNITNTESLTVIGEKAFADCAALEAFEFGKQLVQVGNGAFAGTGLHKANLSGCSALASVGGWTFAHCPHLTSVVLPRGLDEVPPGLLFGCTALTDIALPADAQAIGDYALADVSGARRVRLPETTEYIGSLAMAGMGALESVDGTGLSTVPDLGREVWNGVDQSGITLNVTPDRVEDFKDAEQWKRFRIIGVTDNIDDVVLPEESGLTVTRDGDALIFAVSSSELRKVRIYNVNGLLIAESGAVGTQIRVPLPQGGMTHVLIAEVTTDSDIRIIRKISID